MPKGLLGYSVINTWRRTTCMVLPRVSWWITMTLLVAFVPVLAFNYELPSCDKSFEFQVDRQQHPGLHR